METNFIAMAHGWVKSTPANIPNVAALMKDMYEEGRRAGMRESMARCLNGCVFEAVDRGRGDGSVMLVPPCGTVYTHSGRIATIEIETPCGCYVVKDY